MFPSFHHALNLRLIGKMTATTMVLLSGVALLPSISSGQGHEIIVGQNIRVSRASDAPRVELMIAANPKNSKNLIATAIVGELDADRCKTYTSRDGGYTWLETEFNELPESGSGDPQVGFGPDGTAYFSALGEVIGSDRKRHFAVMLFRSEDGGVTWDNSSSFGSGYAPDHDQIIIDGRRSDIGRFYMSVGHSTAVSGDNIGIFRSDDRGKTVVGPLHAANGGGRGVFSLNPIVFADGTLFVPFARSEKKPLAERREPSVEVYYASSGDGGYTFASAVKIRTQILDSKNNVGSPYAAVLFAVDASERFRDRLYMAWGEAAAGHYHLKFSYSTDKGKTWSEAQEVGMPETETDQFRPAMAVSPMGVVGISWFDTRGAEAGRQYNEYFTASTDGGETFLAPRKISSHSSSLDAVGNLVIRPTIDSPRMHDGTLSFSYDLTGFRFPDGGDYMGLAADAEGIFHPFWADTRDGNYQAWTAQVKIEPKVPTVDDHSPRLMPEIPVTEKLWPIFDPAHYEVETETEEVPVRLMNISDDTICKPIVVRIRRAEPRGMQDDAPSILNAASGKSSESATFDYSNALGDFSCLAPGEVTDAVVWRLKPAKSANGFFTLGFIVTGRLAHATK